MTKRRLCAVSVDLDGLEHYRAIHGLPSKPEGARLVYDIALPRAVAFAASHGIPLTFFAIGRDLLDPRAAEGLRRATRLGHQAENHSLGHRYDLSRLERDAITREVRGGAEVIAAVTDRRPRGFRAPGYLVSDRLFGVLRREGIAWDSSVFPCPAYYLAKLGAIGALRLRGRTSEAIVGDVRVLLAPRRPYRPGEGWHRAGGGDLLELPVAVTRGARLPLIGTSIVLAGKRAGWLARGCLGEPLVSLVLHAVDFLDRGDGLDDLAPAQMDLRLPRADKARALASVVSTLRGAGHRFVTSDEAAEIGWAGLGA